MNRIYRIRWQYSLSMLIALATLVSLACFWVTWPQRAAERFIVEYFQELDVANPFRVGTAEAIAFEANPKAAKRKLKLVPHERTTIDLILGRQTFECEMYEFTICRGTVVAGPTQFWHSVVRSYR